MRSKNRNFKLGVVSALLCANACVFLPTPTHAANGWEIDLNAGDEIAEASSVTITMGSGTADAMLFPESLNPSKAMAMIKRTASVAIGATDGYTIKVSGEPNLVGKNASNKIPSITANTTLAQMNNQWGWYSAEGDVDCDTAQSLKQMNSAGETISSGVLSAAATKNFTMCFGAKVNTSQAADSYSGTVMVSAVAEPKSVVINKPFNGITTMQAMTQDLCRLANVNDTAFLRDTRDDNYYWVTKLLDNNCWMTQNLAFDLSKNAPLTTDTSATAWTPGQNTIQNIPTGGAAVDSETYSWNLGKYVIIDPTATEVCANSTAGLDTCSERFMKVGDRAPSSDPNFYKNNGNKTYTDTEYDAHYLVGNYYQWNAAVAGTGGTIVDALGTGSVCPKNWKLPDSKYISDYTFGFLLQKYGLATSATSGSLTGAVNGDTYNIALSPLFFVRSGNIVPNFQYLERAGQYGRYWSLRAYSNTGSAYEFYFNKNSARPSSDANRYYGLSLRCYINPNFYDFG